MIEETNAKPALSDADYIKELEGLVCFLARCYEKTKEAYFDKHMAACSVANPNRRDLTDAENSEWQRFPMIQGTKLQKVVSEIAESNKHAPKNIEGLMKRFVAVLGIAEGEKKERIICAAIQIVGTGKVFYGHRHDQCNNSLKGELSWTMNRQEMSKVETVQGFVTTEGRFVDRKEGLKIALDNNQVIDISQIRGDNLHSEDLY